MQLKKYSDSIRETLSQLMKKDKKIILMGLGINDPKGIFGTTTGLSKIFGNNRVIEPPTSESALTGICIGAAIKGMKPFCLIRELNSVYYQLSK